MLDSSAVHESNFVNTIKVILLIVRTLSRFIAIDPRSSLHIWVGIAHWSRSIWSYDSEAAQAKSSDLVLRRGNWWLKVVGKGEIGGDVPISDELIADLARYRLFNGLSATPSSEEDTPLILSIGGRNARFLTATAIYMIVKKIFRRASKAVAETNPSGAAILLQARQLLSIFMPKMINDTLIPLAKAKKSGLLHLEIGFGFVSNRHR